MCRNFSFSYHACVLKNFYAPFRLTLHCIYEFILRNRNFVIPLFCREDHREQPLLSRPHHGRSQDSQVSVLQPEFRKHIRYENEIGVVTFFAYWKISWVRKVAHFGNWSGFAAMKVYYPQIRPSPFF